MIKKHSGGWTRCGEASFRCRSKVTRGCVIVPYCRVNWGELTHTQPVRAKSGVARSHFGSTTAGTERSLSLCFHCESAEHFLKSFFRLSQMPNAVLKLLSLLDSFLFSSVISNLIKRLGSLAVISFSCEMIISSHYSCFFFNSFSQSLMINHSFE